MSRESNGLNAPAVAASSREQPEWNLKKNVLLIDADADSVGVVVEAAAQTGQAVRLAATSRDAFRILRGEIAEVDAVILDVDPGAHAMALLEALNGCDARPPVIVVTALEEEYMKSIAARHGASACVGKPLTVEKMRFTLAHLPRDVRSGGCSCDAWGHVHETPASHACCVSA